MRNIWLDENKNELDITTLSDDYLKNICRLLYRGGGYSWFVTKSVIDDVFKEAYKRRIKRADILLCYHVWAYYLHGISEHMPKVYFTKDDRCVELNDSL